MYGVVEMERFIPGRNYVSMDQWGKPKKDVYTCTRRSESYVYFTKNKGWTEIRRKPYEGWHEEEVKIDKGEGSRIRGIKNYVTVLRADKYT